jgi:PatG Domain
MEQPEVKEQVAIVSASGNDAPAPVASAARPVVGSLTPQTCSTCGAAPATNGGAATTPSYIYAIGRIEPRFPRPSVEKEYAQATGRAETAGLTDRQAVQKVLSQRQNRYLMRQMCWLMTIEGLETYILTPRDPSDLDLLVEALRPAPSPPARNVQWADGPCRCLRSDLFLRPRCAD